MKQPSTVDPKKHNINIYRPGTLRDLSLANLYISLSVSISLRMACLMLISASDWIGHDALLYVVQGFTRCFRNPNRVPRIENRVPKISESCHRVPRIRENRVPRIREIGSLQVHTGYLTFHLKKTCRLFLIYFHFTEWAFSRAASDREVQLHPKHYLRIGKCIHKFLVQRQFIKEMFLPFPSSSSWNGVKKAADCTSFVLLVVVFRQ